MGEKPLSEKQRNFAEKLFIENYKLLSKRVSDLLRGVDPSAAEDCLGNLFLTLCLSVEKVMEHENPVSWLFLTAKYICLKHIRSVGAETKRNLPIDDILENRLTEEQAMEDKIIDDILWCQWEKENIRQKLLSGLNANERKILKLRFEDGKSNLQIGKEMGKSEDAVRFTVYYIKKKITEKIYSGNF